MSCRSSPTIPNHTKPYKTKDSESQRVRRVKKGSKEAQKSQNKKEKETIFMKSELGCQRVRAIQGLRDLRSEKVRRVSKEA